LSAAERRVVAESLLLLTIVRAGLILLPLRTVQKRCAKALERVSAPSEPSTLTPQRIVRLVHLVSRLVPGAHCLPRSLVAQLLLRRGGFDPILRIGVRKQGHRLDAHAWLELEGAAVMEDDELLQELTPFQSSFVSAPKVEP
jgi:hypothetical protein